MKQLFHKVKFNKDGRAERGYIIYDIDGRADQLKRWKKWERVLKGEIGERKLFM